MLLALRGGGNYRTYMTSLNIFCLNYQISNFWTINLEDNILGNLWYSLKWESFYVTNFKSKKSDPTHPIPQQNNIRINFCGIIFYKIVYKSA